MKKLLFLCLALVFIVQSSSFAQMNMPEHIKEKMTYPVLDFAPWVGVIPVVDPAMSYDPTLTYKIALDIYGTFKDSTKMYDQFTEIARTYNLFIANGVPAEKIKIAAIVHGGISRAVLSNTAFKAKYGVDNPTILALQELKKVGVEFYLCGQSMAFLQLPQEDIASEVKVAISAKTTFVMLDQMGYSYLNVSGN